MISMYAVDFFCIHVPTRHVPLYITLCYFYTVSVQVLILAFKKRNWTLQSHFQVDKIT